MKNLFLTTLVVLGLLAACNTQPEKKEVGLQLWSLREDVQNLGIEKVLEEVGLMGYSKVELAGYGKGQIYGMEPAAFREMAEQYGLKVTSSHVVRKRTADTEADMAFWKEAIEAHASIGVNYIIMPAYPFNRKDTLTMEDVDLTCAYFNEVGKMAAAAGLKFGFHNHEHEFTHSVDGVSVFDLFLEKLDPALVFLQMDVYWVTVGGQDPVDYLQKHAGRFPVLHIKDEKAIGASGEMEFQSIFEAAYAQGMVDFYVEVEEYDGTPMEDVKKSFETLDAATYVK